MMLEAPLASASPCNASELNQWNTERGVVGVLNSFPDLNATSSTSSQYCMMNNYTVKTDVDPPNVPTFPEDFSRIYWEVSLENELDTTVNQALETSLGCAFWKASGKNINASGGEFLHCFLFNCLLFR